MNTPLTMDAITLGGNRFGSALDETASYALLDHHLERGGTYIDTALVYADWLPGVERACSEKLLGRWMASRGVADRVVVTTKGGHPDVTAPLPQGGKRASRLDPASLRLDASRSLENLGLSCLPLWWLHRDDPSLPVEEILSAVEELKAEGLLASWGVANWTADRLQALRVAAHRAGVTGPSADSVAFALAPPAPGALAADLVVLGPELAALHESDQLPLMAYSAQAKGWFDKAANGAATQQDGVYDHGATRKLLDVLSRIAAELDATPTEVAVAALKLLSFPTSAVVGPGSIAQLDSCWRAAELDLAQEHRDQLRPWVSAAIRAGGDRPLADPTENLDA